MSWTFLNTVRGLFGNSLRYMGLELFPLLGLSSCLIVANVFDRKKDLHLSIVGLIVAGYACAIKALPESSAALHDIRTYAMASPGLVALLLVNLALRAPRPTTAVLWVVLSMPLYLQQLLTMGRGLWTGGLAGLLFSFVLFARFGSGSRARWSRCGLIVVTIVGLGLIGAIQAAVFMGRQDLFQDLTARWSTTTSTKISYETRSNFIRLWEYATALGQIRRSPWIGHGLGYAFMNKEPFSGKTFDQWYVHESYLMICVKQGVIGVLLFLWLLTSAIFLGVRGARREEDPWAAALFATTGAATVFLAVLALSNFPFGLVNEMFLLAFLWGSSMAMVRNGFIIFRWRAPAAEMVEIPRAHLTRPEGLPDPGLSS
jgi:hypothetical protein